MSSSNFNEGTAQAKKPGRCEKHKKPVPPTFADQLAELVAVREFSEWLRNHDPDPPSFDIKEWPGANAHVDITLCAGFDWVCPACWSKVDPVTYAPLPSQEGCNACRNNQALRPMRLGRVSLFSDQPAPFLIGGGGKLQAVCEMCVKRYAPGLNKNVCDDCSAEQTSDDDGFDIPF